MEQLDMHEFENDAIRKANLIKEGKKKSIFRRRIFGTFRKRRIVKKNGIPHERYVVRLLTN